MTGFPAKSRTVVFGIYPGVTALDVVGPVQVFSEVGQVLSNGDRPYEVVLGSSRGGPIESDTGIVFETVRLADLSGEIDTVVVSGGIGVFDAATDPLLLDWIVETNSNVRRMTSTCMGTFLTAAAGLLDGRRVATHWRWCDKLREQYPRTIVMADQIFVRDGSLWSSAGVTAGIDLALAMVEEDIGRETALAVARRLVVLLKRPGGQSQFSFDNTDSSHSKNGRFKALHLWIKEHLSDDLRVDVLATKAGMSPRTFTRLYTKQMGITPARAVETLRVEAARHLLETDDRPLKVIARDCGFLNVDRLRNAFIRQVGVFPNSYRNHFGARSAGNGQ